MFINLSTSTKITQYTQKRSSDIQTVSKTTILKNKNGLRLNYTDLVEISEQTIQI